MFTTKCFIRKNKIGNFLKNVREHYIRDDISCGFSSCDTCQPIQSNLSPDHQNECKLVEGNHYIILDTNVILNQMDVLDETVLEMS
ncbi:hypothetical protein HHI36_018993 [Cryptolaemus montrouzieri]|uniref:PIN domain-containing protein n=1 Tax=Cryptolaemus montrouzieri TaxID=559131 RepID=A0ABD2P1M2_9CUCU